MQVYLVGGAVRDRLLGLPERDRDWVVVGSTPEEMVAAGYKQVGASFPVFIHPQTGEEYALARTERKTGKGYHGFAVDFNPNVTIEEDLRRRDITINAMALDAEGNLIDPYGGAYDLTDRRIRIVSDAFEEDPVRVFRVARFAARFGFVVSADAASRSTNVVKRGALAELPVERIWTELQKGLMTNRPERFISLLFQFGALKKIMPELSSLKDVPQPAAHHPEICAFKHTLLALRQAAKMETDLRIRWAVLLHDLGKATTPQEEWPRHIAHEHRGIPLVEAVCERFKVSKDMSQFAVLVCKHHLDIHRFHAMKGRALYERILTLDAIRRPDRFADILKACECDARGREGLEDRPYDNPEHWMTVARIVANVKLEKGEKSTEEYIADLRQMRIRAIDLHLRHLPKAAEH